MSVEQPLVNTDPPENSSTVAVQDGTDQYGVAEGKTSFLERLRRVYPAIMLLLFVCLILIRQFQKPSIIIPVTGQFARFQIYTFDNGYTEENSNFYPTRTVQEVGGTTTQIRFPIHDRFRLDFLKSGTVAFRGILYKIEYSGLSVITTTYAFDPTRLFTHGMRLQADGTYIFDINDDPYVDIPLAALPVRSVNTALSFAIFGFLIAVPALAIFLYRVRGEFVANPAFFLAALCVGMFVSFLAVTLPFNHGPDEFAHVLAGRWYLDHILPPSMSDPVFYDPSFGWDYLIGGPDLTYWLTFKTVTLIDALATFDLFVAARIAQIILCLLCSLVIVRYSAVEIGWAFLLSLAVVPQLAYTLTYVNGDILSYSITFAALAILWKPRPDTSLWAVPVCLFLLCNTKVNYIILIPVALYLIYRNYGYRVWPWVALGLAAGSYKRVLGLLDEHIVGRTFLQNELLHAAPAFKKQLVTTDWSHLTDWQFYSWSLKSLYGVFGYMTWFLSWQYYVVGISLVFVLLKANPRQRNWAIAACFAVSVAASQYATATLGYQPQGRYLFPAVAVLFLFTSEKIVAWKYFWYAIPAAMALGSFWAANNLQFAS